MKQAMKKIGRIFFMIVEISARYIFLKARHFQRLLGNKNI